MAEMVKMANTVKPADLPVELAAKIFVALNRVDVVYMRMNPFGGDNGHGALYLCIDPSELIYPEGWYFAKGHFRNKHNTDSGLYYEIPMYQFGGRLW